MAARTTLNAKNLRELGAERLAKLLVDISTGNAAALRLMCKLLKGQRVVPRVMITDKPTSSVPTPLQRASSGPVSSIDHTRG